MMIVSLDLFARADLAEVVLELLVSTLAAQIKDGIGNGADPSEQSTVPVADRKQVF